MTEKRRAWNSTLPASTKPMARKAMKRGGKGLPAFSKKRAKQVRESRAKYGKATGPCEMRPFLSDVQAWPAWIRERYGNQWEHPAFTTFEWHHPFGERWHDEPWNRMRVCQPAHTFEDEFFGSAGFVVCLLALQQRGDLLSNKFYLDVLGWSPLGKLANWLDDGLFKANPTRRIVGEPWLLRKAESLVMEFP